VPKIRGEYIAASPWLRAAVKVRQGNSQFSIYQRTGFNLTHIEYIPLAERLKAKLHQYAIFLMQSNTSMFIKPDPVFLINNLPFNYNNFLKKIGGAN
jgi:hypothetical protein